MFSSSSPDVTYHHLPTQIDRVSKVYPSSVGAKVAVKTTSLGIPKGQCFGLLGINGAGKSSLLSILSGKLAPPLRAPSLVTRSGTQSGTALRCFGPAG